MATISGPENPECVGSVKGSGFFLQKAWRNYGEGDLR